MNQMITSMTHADRDTGSDDAKGFAASLDICISRMGLGACGPCTAAAAVAASLFMQNVACCFSLLHTSARETLCAIRMNATHATAQWQILHCGIIYALLSMCSN